jgi:hypothetical protein
MWAKVTNEIRSHSARRFGRIFYRGALLAHEVLTTVELTYETSLKALFDPVIQDISAAFIIAPAFGRHQGHAE